MRKRILALPVVALTLGLIGSAPAQAHDHGNPAPDGSRANPVKFVPSQDKPVFLAAKLLGRNEVPDPAPGAKPVNDPDGSALVLVKIKGNKVSFALSYKNITAPVAGHIHEGKAGVNGGVKVGLFTTPLPDTVRAAAGAVNVADQQVITSIRNNPAGFYANIHTAEFGGGAVRGQLRRIQPVDLLSVVKGGPLRAFLDGDQEVDPGDGKAFADPDGHAVAFVRAKRDRIDYSLAWVGIGAPTKVHLHNEKFGVNGKVVVDAANVAVPENIFAITGTVSNVDPALTSKIQAQPNDFYVNLHTAEFPGGAVRGQLFR